jgi:hypothetical protein
MADDRAVRRVARMRKWAELIERHGSDRGAWTAINESPEWKLTYQLYPHSLLDDARRSLALDLMIEAEARPEPGTTSTVETVELDRLDSLDLGTEYTGEELVVAVRLLEEKQLKARRLEEEASMSYRRALRLWHLFDSGATGLNEEGKLTARSGIKWIKRSTPEGDRWTLTRSG